MKKILAPQCRKLGLSVLALGLSSCGVFNSKDSSTDPGIGVLDQALISQNLVDAVAQYPKLNPLLATVQVTEADSAFEQQVHAEMSERGYKMERNGSVDAANSVTAKVRPAIAGNGDSALYVVSVGKLSAERHYTHVDGNTVPTSELVMRGAERRSLTLNDDELFRAADDQFDKVVFKPSVDRAISEPVKQLAAVENDASVAWPPTQTAIKRNMYENMESNYLDVFTEYEDLEQSVLIFPNDSLLLGDTNKRIIQQYVELMDPATDVLSVIGCSHGNTEISNGNSLLALGRANRVKEAFLFSGVEHDRVLEEGCWAPVTFDEMMPRRGVVLTLKRRKSS